MMQKLELRAGVAAALVATWLLGAAGAAAQCKPLDVAAWSGMPLPGGGSLQLSSNETQLAPNAQGDLALVGGVSGSPQDQGVFVVDRRGLRAIALGCAGGCGDAAPGGGTFTTFYKAGSPPGFNAAGDVVFLADVSGGPSPRGLFLYHAGTGALEKVVAVGDATPQGGTFTVLGAGMLSDAGQIAFFGNEVDAGTGLSAYLWSGGAISRVLASGDPAPAGGIISAIQANSFKSGKQPWVVLDRPALDADGRLAIKALVSGGPGGQLIVIDTNTGHAETWLATGQLNPLGESWFNIQGQPVLNGAGQVAIDAQVGGPLSELIEWWLLDGSGGQLLFKTKTQLSDGQYITAAYDTLSPSRPVDEGGDLILHAIAAVGSKHFVISCAADGTNRVLAQPGASSSNGVTLTSIGASPPSLVGDTGLFVANVSGMGPAIVRVHDVFDSWVDLGQGLAGTHGVPALSGTGSLVGGSVANVDLVGARENAAVFLLIGLKQANAPFKGGVLVPLLAFPPVMLATDAAGEMHLQTHVPPLVPPCTTIVMQDWIVDPAGPHGAAASNGLEAETP